MYFYESKNLAIPEFRYKNKLDVLKPKEIEMLEDYLNKKEAYEAKKLAEEIAKLEGTAAAAGAGGVKGKADPKKDNKAKAPAKGAAPLEDKNSP